MATTARRSGGEEQVEEVEWVAEEEVAVDLVSSSLDLLLPLLPPPLGGDVR